MARRLPRDTLQTKPFLVKLHRMVDDPTTESILTWTPAGDALVILDTEEFTKHLLPLYFKHSNLSSFVRQLNTYGFSKLESGAWVFGHPHFRRGKLESLAFIQRKSSHQYMETRTPPLADNDLAPGTSNEVTTIAPESSDGSNRPGFPEEVSTPEEVAAMRKELGMIKDYHNIMASRIRDLSEHVQEARRQQAGTKESIGKIMGFLSQVYNASRTKLVSLAPATNPALPMLSSDVQVARSPYLMETPAGDTRKRLRDEQPGNVAALATAAPSKSDMLFSDSRQLSIATAIPFPSSSSFEPQERLRALTNAPMASTALVASTATHHLATRPMQVPVKPTQLPVHPAHEAVASQAAMMMTNNSLTSYGQQTTTPMGPKGGDASRQQPQLSLATQHSQSGMRHVTDVEVTEANLRQATDYVSSLRGAYSDQVEHAAPAMAQLSQPLSHPAKMQLDAAVSGPPPQLPPHPVKVQEQLKASHAAMVLGNGRPPTLGQQAAMALPPDVQEVALNMVQSIELQDIALNHCQQKLLEEAGELKDRDGADLEAFLWDFLETSQDAVEMNHFALQGNGSWPQGLADY